MSDYLVRAMAADNSIRAFCCTTRDMVEKARTAHGTSPVATACLGRLLSAGVIMGCQMKNDDDLLTVTIKGDGPVGGVVVTANNHGQAKGYVYNPDVDLPPKANGHLDVSGAIGAGTLQVIRDTGMREPYVGTIGLVSGEIAEDITYYYAQSEQIPSAVALGVLVNSHGVMQAGGLMVQVMPFAPDEVIDKLEKKFSEMKSMTTLLNQGMTPEDILRYVFEGMDVEFTDRMPVEFSCNCSRERVEAAVLSAGKNELLEMIDEGHEIEVNCNFCGKHYIFTVDDLKNMLVKGTSENS